MEQEYTHKEDFEGDDSINVQSMQHDKQDPDDDVYPDAVLNIARESASVFQLKRKRDKAIPMLNLDPDFQRLSAWNSKQKSELIESILMGIPLPLIYVKEDENGVFIIVDGKQRLTTLFDFIDNKFPLENLTILRNLNKLYFKNLSEVDQNKIEDCSLTLHVIKAPTSDRVTFDLFDRVNRGGTRLNNQEMRNALYQGNSTKFLKRISESEEFQEAVEGSIPKDRMKDRYLILRFIAFYMWQKGISLDPDSNIETTIEYKSNLEDFLSKSMRFLNHLEENSQVEQKLESIVRGTLKASVKILGKGCFRLPPKEGGFKRPINMALFETICFYLAELQNEWDFKSTQIKKGYRELLKDTKFIDSLTRGVDSNKQTDKRFDIITEKIQEIKDYAR